MSSQAASRWTCTSYRAEQGEDWVQGSTEWLVLLRTEETVDFGRTLFSSLSLRHSDSCMFEWLPARQTGAQQSEWASRAVYASLTLQETSQGAAGLREVHERYVVQIGRWRARRLAPSERPQSG